MKRAGADVELLSASKPEILNSCFSGSRRVVMLKTAPVGAPLLPKRSTGVGMLTPRTGTGGGPRFRGASRKIIARCSPAGIVRNPEGRAGWNFGDAPRIQQIWINRTSVGNAILVDQR